MALVGAVLGLAVVLGSASAAFGKVPARPPAVIAHAAGHKIA